MNKNSKFAFINKAEVQKIITIFQNEGAEIRFVGGCVRNIILQKEVKDIDCSIDIIPDKIINILKKNNLKYRDFAIKYGLVTILLNKHKFEITSLRKDINQKGRETDILYTNDWQDDAKRRDFSFNAIYLKSNGNFVDYFGGMNDLKESKIKFIGDTEKRILEDFLRIFRYYRFLGLFKKPIINEEYDEIILKHLSKAFIKLSNEIIRIEILKMLNNFFPINSFFHNYEKKQKRQWLELTEKHFVETNYDLGIKKCLNKVNLLIN